MQIPGTWLEDENGNPYGICSMAELIFLSNGQNVEDRLTGDITINGDVNYSTEEQLTGKRWIDGKPIYVKSFYAENIPSGSSISTILGTINNVDKMINVDGSWKWAGDTDIQQIGNRGGSKAWTDIILRTNDVIATSSAGCDYLLSHIFYTKTTDTANSPVKTMQLKPMLNYSTEEQIVGTWIDGKPLYQRTILGENTQSWNAWVDTGIIIPNVGIFMTRDKGIVDPADWDFTEDRIDVSIVNSTGMVRIKQGISSSSVHFSYYVTVQYTKTTDMTTLYISPDASNYTLDEKVVGHWIDGKPVYQKTFTNLSAVVRAGDWCKVVELDNPKNVISCDLYRVGGEGQLVHISIRDFTIGAAGYTNCLTITPFDSYTIVMATIQYTKTTD